MMFLTFIINGVYMAILNKMCLVTFVLLTACDVKINNDFNIPDNTNVENVLISVNGDINIGKNCIVNADLNTVNGNITIKKFSHIEASIQTVNGSISIDDHVKVDGNISTLTGVIEINNANVTGDISNISGDIMVYHIILEGDLVSNFGNISIKDNSIINGNVIINKNDEIPEKLKSVKIKITGGSSVTGDLINDSREVIVSVFVEEGSSIKGEIIDADIVDSLEGLEYE